MSIELKIKAKSLAAEAGIIRTEEARLAAAIKCAVCPPLTDKSETAHRRRARYDRLTSALSSIVSHRRTVVRREARYTNLARAFLRGRSYERAENKVLPPNVLTPMEWDKIAAMVKRHGPGDVRMLMQRFDEWRQQA
mgnify:CR=1 FL=1